MDPPVVSISTERFTKLWEVFQEEANKLASGSECSAMKMYASIYQIVSGGDSSYAVRLHWCIGKFFFALCVKLREKIHGDNWVEEYAVAFCQYEKAIEIIHTLALHLNEAILENKECKNVRDLGYVIWERCILRQRYEEKLPCLSEALPARKEYAEICLRSLSKIVTNANNKLEYYKNNYEAGLFASIVEEFKAHIEMYKQTDLSAYLVRCSECIAKCTEAYSVLLLPMSIAGLQKILEKVVFTRYPNVLKEEIHTILHRRETKEIGDLCSAVRLLSKKVFPAFLEYLSEFIVSVWPEDRSCASAAGAYKELCALLSCEMCEQTRQVLVNTLSIKITRPGIGGELSVYLEELVKQKNLSEIKIVDTLLGSISVKEEKEVFYGLYVQRLCERLFSLKFDPSVEKFTAESLALPWILRRKVRKIFDDMVQSTKENEQFKSAYGLQNYKYVTSENNEVFFYGIITTACVWPIPEDAAQNINMPKEILNILEAFTNQYLEKNPKKRITWIDTLSMIEVEITTDKVYSIEMPLTHYSVLALIENEPKTLDAVATSIALSTKNAVDVLDALVGISVIERIEGLYKFNDRFSSDQQRLKLEARESSMQRVGNRKPYYQAWVSRYLKKTGECTLSELTESIKNTHTTLFEWSIQEYTEALKSLNDRGLVEIADAVIKYVP